MTLLAHLSASLLLLRETEVTLSLDGSRVAQLRCVWRLRCGLFICTAKMPELAVENVVVHPLVLLSVVDHFNR